MTGAPAQTDRKHLLVVYHSQTGNTRALIEAAVRGAQREDGVQVKLKRALAADLTDLLWAHGLMFGTPENFGFMSGALKYFFDRTYYPAEGKVQGMPYLLIVSAGNDGSGAARQVDRIATGYGWREAQPPTIVVGEPGPDDLNTCEELGEAFATGLAMGVF